MGKNTAIRYVLASVALVFMCGCINYEQETSLNPDMSGRIEIHIFPNPKPVVEEIAKKVAAEDSSSLNPDYSLSKATYSAKMKIKEEGLLEGFNQEAIKNKSFRKIEQDGTTHYYLTIEFDDIRKLCSGKRTIDVVDDGKGLVTYTELIKTSQGEKKAGDADGGGSGLFKRFNFKYTLHMPADIISANTAAIDKNTAVWESPLDKVIGNGDFSIKATSKRSE